MAQSFPRNRRLLQATEFKRVFNQPIRSSDAWFSVLAKPIVSVNAPSRLGLVIARKQLKRAVDRNRIKRLIREYFRQHIAPSSHGLDYVVMARSAVKAQANASIRASLTKHFALIQDQVNT